MDQSLEELRAQRASIKAHLDWLDQQIAAAEPQIAEPQIAEPQPPGAEPPIAGAEPPIPESPQNLQQEPESATARATHRTIPANEVAPIADAPIADAPIADAPIADAPIADVSLELEHILQSAPTTNIKRTQAGCLLIFVAAAALFIFLLFGLPYLLD
jgi:hypothetical protein